MKIIGHRGARGLAPENTVLSIEKALEVGVDEIEIDLRVTKDRKVILMHDAYITDDQGKQYLIAEHTYAELQALKPDIALFSEVARTVKRRVPLLVEVKPKVDVAPIIAIFKSLLQNGWETKDFLIGSFSQRTLRALHQALPDIEKVVIEHFSGVHAVWRARQVGAKRINISYHFVWFGYLLSMRHSGYGIYPYTLNNPAKAKKWQKYGLAGVITDRPDLFR